MHLHASKITIVLVLSELVCFVDAGLAANKRRKREHKTLIYNDCGRENAVMKFEYVSATPMPVHLPGKLKMTIKANVSADLPEKLTLAVRIYKYMFGIPVRVPCFYGLIGSCNYPDLCGQMYEEGEVCPSWVEDQDLPCSCPIQAGRYKLSDYEVFLPQLDSFAGFFARGEYSMRLRVQNEEDLETLGCLDLKFHVRQRRRRRYGRFYPR